MRMTYGPNAVFEVTSVEEALIAEAGGAGGVVVSVAHDRPVLRMADTGLIGDIKRKLLNIPVMAKVRIGHVVEARIAAAIGVDYIDESELLSQVDPQNFINKGEFMVPFVCGCNNLGTYLKRLEEGAEVIRIQADVYRSCDFTETVGYVRRVKELDLQTLMDMDEDEVSEYSQSIGVPSYMVSAVKQKGRLPVVPYASGGIFSPSDAALMMEMGCAGVFVGPEVFKFPNSRKRVEAIVNAVKYPENVRFLSTESNRLEHVLLRGQRSDTPSPPDTPCESEPESEYNSEPESEYNSEGNGSD